MRKIREVLRLKFLMEMGNRDIAESCKISPATVSEVLFRFQVCGLAWPLPEEFADQELEDRLYPQPQNGAERYVPDWSYIHAELGKKHVTLMLLWEEYHREHPDGYSYSWFCEAYGKWCKKLDLVMRQNHIWGEKCYVDYAGDTVTIIDPETGEVNQAQVFIGVLGKSTYTYVEATWSQELGNWIASHVRMFGFFCGTPKVLVPDNLKSGVTKACYYEPEINKTYHELAEHYGIAVIPARKYRPKDKAKVENGVLLVERWILAALRKRTFYFLGELNEVLRELCHKLNHKPFQKIPGSRHELFIQQEKKALRPLPSSAYEIGQWKKATVNMDYHIEIERHYYSVPYRFAKEKVEARFNPSTVEIFHKGVRIASHPRSYVPHAATTTDTHMPSHHRIKTEWSEERIRSWAASMGADVELMVVGIMAQRKHPEQAFRSCFGLLKLAEKVGKDRLAAACRRATVFHAYSFKHVKSILDRGMEQEPLPENVTPIGKRSAGYHENVRGAAYYAVEGGRQ